MNKIYVITKDYYEDSVLCNVRILGYVTSEEEAQKILADLNNDDIYKECPERCHAFRLAYEWTKDINKI